MLVHQVGEIKERKESNLLKRLSIWNKQVEDISSYQLWASFHRIRINTNYDLAIRAMNVLSSEAIISYVMGEIDDCPLLHFTPVDQQSNESHLVTTLNRFSHFEKRAYLFSIYSGVDLDEISALTHISVHKYNFLENARFKEGVSYILKTQPRHICFKYVFWEFDNLNFPCRFENLRQRFYETTNLYWDNFIKSLI